MSDYINKQKYRSDIDGLRAIAVLLVIGYHAFPMQLKAGFIGVDIFFVISGFLISTIIFESLKQDNFSFIEFYSRRIRRIFPSLIIVLTACLAFGWFTLFQDEYKQLGRHSTSATQFISNFTLWKENGYFDNAADTKPLLHLWSLGVEEQFYIIWPLLLWASWKQKFNWLTLCVIIAAISFTLNLTGIRTDAIATFYSPQTRFWELVIGSLLAYLTRNNQNPSQKIAFKLDGWLCIITYLHGNTWCNVRSILGAALLALGVLFITKENYFPGVWALLPVLGSTLIILSGSQAWLNRTVLSSRILVWFGLISFPLYLWHWPMLSFARIIDGESPSILVRIIAVLIAIALAWLTYTLIEKPIRFSGFKKVKTTTLLLLMAIIGLIGYNIDINNGFQDRPIAKNALDFKYESNPLGYLPCKATALLKGGSPDFCLINAKEKSDAVLIGDSHADDKFYGIVKNDSSHNWMLIANNSCPPVYGIKVEVGQTNCQEKFLKVLNWIIQRPEIKTVTLSYYGNYFLTTNYAADHLKLNIGPKTTIISSLNGNKSRSELFEQGLNDTIQKLQQANKKVILFIDVPELPFLPKDCHRNPYSKCTVTKKEVDLRQFELRQMIQKLKTNNSELFVFDPINLFCKDNVCIFKDNKKILYRDSHHLTLKGSDAYGSLFVEWERAVLSEHGKIATTIP